MWALIRFLPQMIGHLVPIDYPPWAVFLLLRTIMDMVFSPRISVECTHTLDGLVEEHHSMFIEVSNDGNDKHTYYFDAKTYITAIHCTVHW